MIIVVVAAFNIVASLTMIVLSKVREVAILKSMGASSTMVARIFLIGGTTVGLIGTGLGIGYGLLVCLLARLYGYPLDPKVYLIGELPVQIRREELVGVAAATILICVAGDAVPVAARQPARRRRGPPLHLELDLLGDVCRACFCCCVLLPACPARRRCTWRALGHDAVGDDGQPGCRRSASRARRPRRRS